jgi:hypothetical protein
LPRFVILEHDWPHLHWDLMLEDGPRLRTWRLAQPPRPACDVQAEAIGDHRLDYLDYEGPVSGNRGSVRRWDAGAFVWQDNRPERVATDLFGTAITGRLQLTSGPAGWVARLEQFDNAESH